MPGLPARLLRPICGRQADKGMQQMMNSGRLKLGLGMMPALLTILFISGCGQSDKELRERLQKAAADKARMQAIAEEMVNLATSPERPTDCAEQERSGVLLSDRYDVALKKTDTALAAVNNRIARCAKFNVAVQAVGANPLPLVEDAKP